MIAGPLVFFERFSPWGAAVLDASEGDQQGIGRLVDVPGKQCRPDRDHSGIRRILEQCRPFHIQAEEGYNKRDGGKR
ncbi:hypothetical protein ABNN70_02340 [Sporolactobacillus sp. Y61]|uniref:Uncharacterized protein n=1 Tax=Sporolactobacillus sp. Y61 TaxID=3160863 RepID=A0AAU8IGM7_9BACL